MYPGHVEDITQAEFKALALRLGLEIEEPLPFTFPVQFDSDFSDDLGNIHGLVNKWYAGDFNSICVIVPGMGTLTAPALPDSDADLPLPAFVGFGKRVRGVVVGTKIGADQIMKVTDEHELEGHHVQVYVARGTHNNYPTGGQKWLSDSVHPLVSEFDGVDADTPLPVDKKIKKRQAAMVCLAKILGGGLVAGGIACLIEALRDADPSVQDPTEALVPEEVSDIPPQSKTNATIISPMGLVENEGLPNARFWREGADGLDNDAVQNEDVVDDSQIWWPPGTGAPDGYRGTWGADCADNPFDTRSGLIFPDFKGALIEGLIVALGK
jgi:hypothetical protein